MKRLFTIMIMILFVSCKNEKNSQAENITGYVVSGHVYGVENGTIKMKEIGVREPAKQKTIDSTEIINGEFKFIGSVEHIDMIELVIDEKYKGRFMLENSMINLEIDLNNLEERSNSYTLKVSGSKSHDQFVKMDEEIKATFQDPKYKILDTLKVLFDKAKSSNDPKDNDMALETRNKLMPLIEERRNIYLDKKLEFVRNNPSSPVAVYILGYQYTEGGMTRDVLKEFYNLFEGNARNTSFFKHHITKIYKDNFENLGIGNTAPNFTLTSVNGNQITLSEVKAKYKLVDFWASWCVPCRASFPHLKDLRKQYKKEGLEIIGIGTADTEKKWRKAIKEDQTPWIHVFDVNEKRSYGSVAKSYAVPHLPTTFLVDAQGTILLRNPSKEELDAKLKELFGF